MLPSHNVDLGLHNSLRCGKWRICSYRALRNFLPRHISLRRHASFSRFSLVCECNVGAESQPPRRTPFLQSCFPSTSYQIRPPTIDSRTLSITQMNTSTMSDPEPPNADVVSVSMRRRVHSFTTEPLHSAAYLNDIVRYLSDKPPGSARYRAPSPTPKASNFLYTYKTSALCSPHSVPYSQPSMFLSKDANQTDLNLLFFTGSPSSEWLEVLVDHLNVDLRFLHSHLDFIPNAQRDWYTGSNLPSRNRQDFRLLIPSIVFVGTEGNSLSVDQLHAARRSCASQLEKKAHVILSDGTRSHGQSMFRQVNVHRGDAIVVEQVVSIAITGTGKDKKGKLLFLLLWIR